MDKFIATENIRHFRRLLETELDPDRIARLTQLLLAEEAKIRELEGNDRLTTNAAAKAS